MSIEQCDCGRGDRCIYQYISIYQCPTADVKGVKLNSFWVFFSWPKKREKSTRIITYLCALQLHCSYSKFPELNVINEKMKKSAATVESTTLARTDVSGNVDQHAATAMEALSRSKEPEFVKLYFRAQLLLGIGKCQCLSLVLGVFSKLLIQCHEDMLRNSVHRQC
jgi:hypothetical protein